MITAQDIRNYKLFQGLAEDELASVAALCSRRAYEANAVIFDPTTKSEEVFLVEGGNDAIQIEIPLGAPENKIVIHTLSKGEVFGWAPLTSQNIRTAIARCVDRAEVLVLKGKSLRDLLESNPHTGYLVMRNLVDIINTRLSSTTVVLRHEIRRLRKMDRTLEIA